MRKIPTLFIRDPGTRLVIDEVTPGCEWVPAGEGTAHAKWDGTACMIRDGRLFRRHDAKRGKTPPADFEPAQEPDPVTGHWPGWVTVGDGPEDRWHREAFGEACPLLDGTYELIGPKIQGNPHGLVSIHILVPHAGAELRRVARDFTGLRSGLALVRVEETVWLPQLGIMGGCSSFVEGIVWHHPDGRMAKIKRRDYRLPWPVAR